ncbi:16S rRNA (uracil(1498)-N(3))-methyltransferase [Faecalispora jeddahensis]|jgi:16S rRNA (uracil1498-N3)-methyltransferase|uniref:16S rRNA (uracil(1498)-N(3))-methyltransferase n=1 Tax=Faecalispora jeddahensis TaxID=1414721 RepID=UPI00189ADB1D|nr:16S rRNA (uracil(1498)-N(3))-methyltransferase [Faecalispora jeddahensis]
MPRFFIDFPCTPGDEPWVDGENGAHIVKSLRMREGEALTLCDGRGTDYRCVLLQTESNRAQVRVLEQAKSISEPSVFVTVYQSLPKADKMDSVVQKAVECGACRVVPVLSARCVSRPDEKAARKKAERWQKIALEAAKQSGRGIVPEVAEITPYAKAVEQAAADGGRLLFFYEGGGQSLRSLGLENEERISLFIGPEGGFAQDEVELARQNGAQVATLGPRIFRTETAPVAALSVLMMLTGNMEQDAVWEE